jgi:hypothetical protein
LSRRTQIILAGVAAAALTATGVTAYAQAKPDPAPRRVEREVRIERDGADVRVERDGKTVVIRHGDHAEMRRDRAEHLKAILQLRPNQDAALTAYLEAMKPKERTIRVDREDGDGKTTTPERLARMEQRLNERQAEERGRIEATRRFYGQLDAAQKRAFDELPPMMGGGDVRIFRTMHHGGPMPGFHGHFDGERFDHAMPIPPVPPTPPAPPRL